tara:strand:- start:440 stop:1273 length:834 start_codon:yes stop_codon:yes gene_type:complete
MDLSIFVQASIDNNLQKIQEHCNKLKLLNKLEKNDVLELIHSLYYLIKYNYIETFENIFIKELSKFKTQIINIYNNCDFFDFEVQYTNKEHKYCTVLNGQLNVYNDYRILCLLSIGLKNDNLKFINKLLDYGFDIKISSYSGKYLINQKYQNLLERLYNINRFQLYKNLYNNSYFLTPICEYLCSNSINKTNEPFFNILLKYAFIRENELEFSKNNNNDKIDFNDYCCSLITFWLDEDGDYPIDTIQELKEIFYTNKYNYNFDYDSGCYYFCCIEKI